MKINFLFLAAIICVFISCSDSTHEVQLKTCDVVIGGLQSSIEGGGLDGTQHVHSISDVGNNVLGLNIKVENLSYVEAVTIEKEFVFDDNEEDFGDVLIHSVYPGNNRFIAEAYENEPLNGWYDIDILDSEGFDLTNQKELDLFSEEYTKKLKIEYPVYNIFRDTVEQEINPSVTRNEVDFNMKAVNGRLAVVIENRKENSNIDYVEVKINDGELRRIEKNKVISYIVNDKEFEGKVKVMVYCYLDRDPDYVVTRFYDIEKGTNTTRLLTVI